MSSTSLHGKDSSLLMDEFNLQAYFKTFSFKRSKKAEETSVFGITDRTFMPGTQGGSVSGGGLFKGPVTGDADTRLRAAFADSTSGQVCSAFVGGATLGNRAFLWQQRVGNYSLDENNDGLVASSFDSVANDGLDAGVCLKTLAAETASANQTSFDYGATGMPSSEGAVGHLHITAVSGTTPSATVKIQHSPDDSAWADLITFTAAVAVGSQRGTVATGVSIDRYIRSMSTITGTTPSFTYTVSFARRYDVDTASFTFELYPAGTVAAVKYTGETLCTGYSVDISNDGLVTFSSDFQNTGAITDSGTGTAFAVHGKGAAITLDDNRGGTLVALTDKGRTWSYKRERKNEDSKVFGSNRDSYIQGLRSTSFSFGGLWDPTVGEHLHSLLG